MSNYPPPDSGNLMNYRRQAWILTGIVASALLLWALWAFHDAYVADYREKKAKLASTTAKCPFTTANAVSPKKEGSSKKESSCCHASASATETEGDEEFTPQRIRELISKYGLDLDGFSEEQLRSCPHYETYIKPLLEQKQATNKRKYWKWK